MPETNEFTCPKGHTFNAVAKLRARCPTCGQMSRREFTSQKPTSSKPPLEPVRSSVLKEKEHSTPSLHKVVRRPILARGSRPAITSKKVKQSESVKTNDSENSPQSNSQRKPEIVRRGLTREVPRKTIKARAPVKTSKPSSPVKHRTVSHQTPQVKRMPRGSRERKVEEVTGGNEPFWVKVKNQYFR